MEITIRKATMKDMPSVLKLWTKLMEFHRTLSKHFEPADDAEKVWESYVRKQLDESNSLLIVAEVSSNIVGFSLASIQANIPVFKIDKYGVIYDLFVEETFRGRGIGRKIFDFAREWFEQNGVEHLQVSVAHHNPVAQKFWHAMGFTNYMDRLSRGI
ncbi:GNAT family N-acetyltransferase [bacterium]|nr:GNAT family N-acetyltransferase [bacterium]